MYPIPSARELIRQIVVSVAIFLASDVLGSETEREPVVPSFEARSLKGGDLVSALEAAVKSVDPQISVTFAPQATSRKELGPVTITLRDIPVGELARFLASTTGWDVTYDGKTKRILIQPQVSQWYFLLKNEPIVWQKPDNPAEQVIEACISPYVVCGPMDSEIDGKVDTVTFDTLREFARQACGLDIVGSPLLVKLAGTLRVKYSAQQSEKGTPETITRLHKFIQEIQKEARDQKLIHSEAKLGLRHTYDKTPESYNSDTLAIMVISENVKEWIASFIKHAANTKVTEAGTVTPAELSHAFRVLGVECREDEVMLDDVLDVVLIRLTKSEAQRLKDFFGSTK